MLCSRFLRSADEQKNRGFTETTERFFERDAAGLRSHAASGTAPPGAHYGASALVLAATLVMFVKIPKGFIPSRTQTRFTR